MREDPKYKEIKALIRLLDETDQHILTTVEERLLLMREDALPVLEDAAHSMLNHGMQEKISLIIGRINSEKIKDDIKNWSDDGGNDLLNAFLIISKTGFPDLDEVKIAIEIEQIRMDAWLELNDDLTALENIRVLNHILFKHYKFVGNKENPRIPEEQFLPSILKYKKGNSLTLGILYLIIAQKLKLPLAGVNLPEHFILGYLTEQNIKLPSPDDVLFYINPFKGSVFTRREINLFLRQLKVKADKHYFTPCSNRSVIVRFIKTLIMYYQEQKNNHKISELEELLNIVNI